MKLHHIRDVLACHGFLGASIHALETPAGQRQRRRIQYQLESAAALDHYLENKATQLRTETAERFGGRVHCERRVFRPLVELVPAALEPARCLNCGAAITGKYCFACGQASDVHVLSIREVAGDVTHSLLHLDSRVWQTIKLLALKPGELTREFIAGRHQSYLPPFRLYLGISILFFALTAFLPDGEPVRFDEQDKAMFAPDAAALKSMPGSQSSNCDVNLDVPGFGSLREPLSRACRKIQADGGKRFFEHFLANAPKLMFLFLPLMAAVALLLYWRRPRRLYAEHLVLFLHNHAFTFLLITVTTALNALSNLKFPLIGLLNFVMFLLFIYLIYYLFRSMRVVYGEGRFKTVLKFMALGTIYFVLLGVTMLAGLVYTALALV